MKIVITSHKRHDVVHTTKVVNDAIICVPESQYDLYKEYNPNSEIIAHPETVLGDSPKRQWILQKFKDIFLLDDDITAVRRTYLPPSEKRDKLTKDEVTGILYDTYFMLKEQTDIKYFGFAKQGSPLHYNVSKPMYMNGFIRGCAMGVISDGNLHFPDIASHNSADDYMCLLNAHFNRKMWIDNRFFFEFKLTNTNVGGCEGTINNDTMVETFKNMKQHFGNAVTQQKFIKPKEGWISWKSKIPY